MSRPKKVEKTPPQDLIMTASRKRQLLAELELIETELNRRSKIQNPTNYGLPDLLFEQNQGETDEDYRTRQDAALKDCVENHMRFKKDAVFRPIRLIPEMLSFICDIFYRRASFVILWKPRGSGGSLGAAVLIWLMMVYKRQSCVNMAGSAEQSQAVFDYIRTFWEYHPEFKRNLLITDPTAMMLKFISGVYFKCLTGSEKGARGKHPGFLMIDEACQRDERSDMSLSAAMQTVMSEPDPTVVLVSTFHHPTGLFQEVWDFAESRGFKRYKWSIFQSMEKCERGMETATDEDPMALEHCRDHCPLTRRVEVKDRRGMIVDYEYKGCNGTARTTNGFQSFAQVMKAKIMNNGTTVFENEYEGERPEFGANIYSMSKIDLSLASCSVDDHGFPYVDWEYETPKAIGLDWGLNETAIILISLEKEKGYVAVVDYLQLSGKLVPEVANHLERLHHEYSPEGRSIPIYADSSHPYNNLELGNRGFDVVPVEFNKFKEFGIGNASRFFNLERIRILPDFTVLIRQLKSYRRGRDGKPVKKDDHGPDALMSYLDSKVEILTRDGWTQVGDLRVGTEVLTHRGRFRRITRYEPAPYAKSQVVVNLKGKSSRVDSHKVTLEHPFLLDSGEWVEAKDLSNGDRIMVLANRCRGCQKKVPAWRTSCEACVGKLRNRRWADPTSREDEERKGKSDRLAEEYRSGSRNASTNVRAAGAAATEKYRSDSEYAASVREHLRSMLPRVNSPEKLKSQSALMLRLHQRPGFFDHLRTPEAREKMRQAVVSRMIRDRQVPFNCRMKKFTDIEKLMFDSFSRVGIVPDHNLRVGRWWIDLALPDLKVAVECDGGNWHSSPKARERDSKKTKYLESLGWTVFRFSGKMIKRSPDACRDEVLRVAANHEGLYEFVGVEVTSVEIESLKRPKTAFHFEVEEDHSYVGKQGVVSHNCALMHFQFTEAFSEDVFVAQGFEKVQKSKEVMEF